MINLQKLRYLSSICAYCNKVISINDRTNDHIIPKCLGGATETRNIVICCKNCNGLKGNTLINDFLEEHPKKAEYFYNYLNMIDYQAGNNEYSQAILGVLSESLKMSYERKKRHAKKLMQKNKKEKNKTAEEYNEAQIIEYQLNRSGKSFYVNELQAKILDYYLKYPNFSDYKELAKKLGIGKNHIIREITCINNLTGVFKLKKISKSGIILNDLFCCDLQNEISKISD